MPRPITRPRIRLALLAAALAIGAAGVLPASAAPAQPTEKGMTLVVPDAHAKLGTVYYVLKGRDAQVTFTSDAPLEYIKGTNNDVIGYAVVKAGEGDQPPRLVAGEFHLPVKDFDTGIPMRNGHLQSARWLDAATYPDVVFNLAEVRDVKPAKQTSEFATYDLTLVGDMTVKGKTKELTIPARITMMPASEKTKARAPGDLMAIRAMYTIKLSDFGVQDGVVGTKVADELTLETSLFLSNVSPEEARR